MTSSPPRELSVDEDHDSGLHQLLGRDWIHLTFYPVTPIMVSVAKTQFPSNPEVNADETASDYVLCGHGPSDGL